ncbi:MAG: response regulator [Calditrichia bacterium]
MGRETIQILLIEDNPGDVAYFQSILEGEDQAQFSIQWVETIAEGISLARKCEVDIILLDLTLPGSSGVDTFRRLYEYINDRPIVVLTGNIDEQLAIEMMSEGIQDYIYKGHLNAQMIKRVIRYSIERHFMQAKLRAKESHFEAIINASTDGIILVDDQNVIQLSNPAAKKLLAHEQTGIVGSTFDYDMRIGQQNRFSINEENGGQLTIEMNTIEMEWHNRDVYLVLLYDITARQKAEEAIKNAHAIQNVQEFAGAICHEFSQPIQILSGLFSIRLEDYPTCEETQIGVKMIDRISELVKCIGSIERLERQEYLDSYILDIKKSVGTI